MTAKEELLKFIFDNEFITKPRLKNKFELLVNKVIDETQQQVKNLNIPAVSSRSFAKKVSGDGVFFKCSNCSFEPEMESKTDDLLSMNYCPKCGSQFE